LSGKRQRKRGGAGKASSSGRASETTARSRTAPIVAAVDLGTNNCRLLIVSPTKSGAFRVVDSFSRIVRLGEGLSTSGELSAAAIERTVAALKVCADRIAKSGAVRTRAIATHACRDARNGSVLVDRVAAETGLALEIVSAEEEARLAAIGCAPLIGARHEGALVFDVGGGSTEVIWMHRKGTRIDTPMTGSVPVGVVALSERQANAAQDRKWFDAMRAEMREMFAPLRARTEGFNLQTQHLLGTSGTVTTLAGIAMGLDRYVRAKVDGTWHECKTIMRVVDRIVALDHRGRAALGCVGTDRADLIVAGCAIFAAIYDLWPCAQLRVADRGLREGILRELIAESGA
jgi:exopolyphosphatase/guanosine-5'-triphosphate,3'-diphosphate pyrophosphatase